MHTCTCKPGPETSPCTLARANQHHKPHHKLLHRQISTPDLPVHPCMCTPALRISLCRDARTSTRDVPVPDAHGQHVWGCPLAPLHLPMHPSTCKPAKRISPCTLACANQHSKPPCAPLPVHPSTKDAPIPVPPSTGGRPRASLHVSPSTGTGPGAARWGWKRSPLPAQPPTLAAESGLRARSLTFGCAAAGQGQPPARGPAWC